MLGTIPVCVIEVQDSILAHARAVVDMEVRLKDVQVEIRLVVPRQHHCDRAAAERPWRLDCPVSGVPDQAHKGASVVGQVPLQRMIHPEVQIRVPSRTINIRGKWGCKIGRVSEALHILVRRVRYVVCGVIAH